MSAGALLASYLHLHWAGQPAFAARFAAASRPSAPGRRPPDGPAVRPGRGRAVRRLIGVGVGPGDPELITVKAVRVLRTADLVLVPVLARPGEEDRAEDGRAEATVRAHVDGGAIRRVAFALNDTGGVTPGRAAAWDAAAAR